MTRLWSLEELDALADRQDGEKKRIDSMSQEQLAAEVGERLRFSWGWKCACGHIIKGSQTKSAVNTHARIQVHLHWAWEAGLTDQVTKCDICSALCHSSDAAAHAEGHASNSCACGQHVEQKHRKKHERSADHLQWAITKYRFDLALRCEQCSVVYHAKDRHTCGRAGSKDPIDISSYVAGSDLSRLTVPVLKAICKKYSLTRSGKKSDLQTKIRDYETKEKLRSE